MVQPYYIARNFLMGVLKKKMCTSVLQLSNIFVIRSWRVYMVCTLIAHIHEDIQQKIPYKNWIWKCFLNYMSLMQGTLLWNSLCWLSPEHAWKVHWAYSTVRIGGFSQILKPINVGTFSQRYSLCEIYDVYTPLMNLYAYIINWNAKIILQTPLSLKS